MANLIFDYDGTLHQSMLTYAPAFHTKRMSKKTVTKRFTKGKGSGKIE